MRDAREYIYFANKASTDCGLYITDAGVYARPARKYEKVHVSGRNGDILIEDDSFDNVEIRYPAVLVEDFNNNYDAWEAFCLSQKGYKRLSDTFHPDEFRMASFKRIEGEKTTINAKAGTFNLIFDCKPQRYLKSGEQKKTFSTFPVKMINPTQYTASPLIRLYGSGTLTISGVSIVLSTSSAYVDIDCELEEALVAAENLNITTTGGKFPKLKAGENTINWTGSQIDLIPRYYTI